MITRDQAVQALERHDDEIGERLRQGQQDYETALREAREVRLGLINEAVEAGWSMTRIGAELGVSKQRVAQLRAEASA